MLLSKLPTSPMRIKSERIRSAGSFMFLLNKNSYLNEENINKTSSKLPSS
jgi:hypothetical protein